jgi:precorrin-6x reductase
MGDAGGADALASAWSLVYGIPNRRYVAKWGKHGRAAGPIRNQQMLEDNPIDLVIAFPGGAGTADMVSRAEAAGIEVRRITGP